MGGMRSEATKVSDSCAGCNSIIMSILDNRAALKAEIDKVAEVALYLWQKGWAERNGGNITVNISEWVDDEMQKLPAISAPRPIGKRLPMLEGCWFY